MVNKEFKKLQKQNEGIRENLNITAHINHIENQELKEFWENINSLIENEIKQEGLCNK